MSFSSIKEIKRLIGKGMSNIYLKVEKRKFSKLRFSKFTKFIFRPVFGELQLTQIYLNFKLLLQLKTQRSGSKNISDFLIILVLKGIKTF